MRILACGDLHIGAGAQFDREPGSRLADQELALQQIVGLVDEHEVDTVLIAGDVFHRPRPTPSELLVFDRFARQLAARAHVLAVVGNAGHDLEAGDRPCGLDLFHSSIAVHRHPAVWHGQGVSVATLPSVPAHRLIATRNGGDRAALFQDVADLLIETARGLRAEIPASRPAVLLAHWSIEGASLPNGLPVADLNEPVLPLADVEELGFDAVVAGHIHVPAVLTEAPLVLYTGSPYVIDWGEAAVDHGVWLVDLDSSEGEQQAARPPASTPGGALHPVSSPSVRFLPVADRRFVSLDVDVTDGDDFSMLLEGYEPHLRHYQYPDAIVRVRYRATEEQARRVDHAAITAALYEAGAYKVTGIQPTIERAARARVDGMDETLEPLAALDAWMLSLGETLPTETCAALVEYTQAGLEAVRA